MLAGADYRIRDLSCHLRSVPYLGGWGTCWNLAADLYPIPRGTSLQWITLLPSRTPPTTILPLESPHLAGPRAAAAAAVLAVCRVMGRHLLPPRPVSYNLRVCRVSDLIDTLTYFSDGRIFSERILCLSVSLVKQL